MFCSDDKTDNYTTTEQGWKQIINYIPKNKVIYSPFYSDGKMKKYFKNLGFDIIHKNEDFFEKYKNYEYDLLIDNPPFSKRRKIFETLKQLNKPFIMVCLSTLICSKWFLNLFKSDLQIIIPLSSRTTFFNIDTPTKRYTPPLGTFFYCYKMNLENDINYV